MSIEKKTYTIEDIEKRVDLREIIGIPLETKHNVSVCICPFHEEKTPSFTILNNGKQFKCLSCGASGSPMDYIMRKENLSFIEVMEYLSEAYKMPLC